MPTAEPTETPAPTATPAPVQLSLYARVINDGTPLRGNPSPQAYLQNILNKESVVYIFQSQFAEDGMTWYLAQYNGQWGYVRADLGPRHGRCGDEGVSRRAGGCAGDPDPDAAGNARTGSARTRPAHTPS